MVCLWFTEPDAIMLKTVDGLDLLKLHIVTLDIRSYIYHVIVGMYSVTPGPNFIELLNGRFCAYRAHIANFLFHSPD